MLIFRGTCVSSMNSVCVGFLLYIIFMHEGNCYNLSWLYIQAIKQMTISTAPLVLVLHLKRFSFGGMFDKINKFTAFESTLTIPIANSKPSTSPDISDGSTGSTHSGSEPSTAKYSLCGVVVHHGHSVHSGHYVAFVKVTESLPPPVCYHVIIMTRHAVIVFLTGIVRCDSL